MIDNTTYSCVPSIIIIHKLFSLICWHIDIPYNLIYVLCSINWTSTSKSTFLYDTEWCVHIHAKKKTFYVFYIETNKSDKTLMHSRAFFVMSSAIFISFILYWIFRCSAHIYYLMNFRCRKMVYWSIYLIGMQWFIVSSTSWTVIIAKC